MNLRSMSSNKTADSQLKAGQAATDWEARALAVSVSESNRKPVSSRVKQ